MKKITPKPVFSFIIPTLNEEQFLPRLLASLTEQESNDFEVVVVDAQSQDQTVPRAKAFAMRLPHLSVLSSNKANVSSQRNIGAKHTKGEWLIFVDADTVLTPEFLTEIRRYIAKVHPVFFTTWLKTDEKGLLDVFLSAIVILCYEVLLLVGRPLAPGPLTVIRRDIFTLLGEYDQSRPYGEDYDLSLRATKRHIRFQIFRRALYIMSLRRMRRHGYVNMAMLYIRTTILAAITGDVTRTVPGYKTGGHFYRS